MLFERLWVHELLCSLESSFWSLLYVLQILMEKLGQGFWLLLLDMVNPKKILMSILENSAFRRLLVPKMISNTYGICGATVSSFANPDAAMIDSQSEKNSALVSSWMLPFLQSVMDMEAVKFEIIEEITNTLVKVIGM